MKKLLLSLCLFGYSTMSSSNPAWQFLINADAVDVYVDTTSREQNSALFKWENDPQMLELGFKMVIARFSANCESKLIWLDSGQKYLNGKWVGDEMVEKIDVMDISSYPEENVYKHIFDYICINYQ